MPDKNSSLIRLAFVAAAAALLSLSGCATHKGEYRPSIVGPAGFDLTEDEVKTKEKKLENEVNEYRFSEEEKRNIDKLKNDPKYEFGGLMRWLRDEKGDPIKDFIEGLYTKENGNIYVLFFIRPFHINAVPMYNNQIGTINGATLDTIRTKVPVREAFLVSKEILSEWRDHVEAQVRADESYMLYREQTSHSDLRRRTKEIKKEDQYNAAREFLGIRPKASHQPNF